jgi:hypothetical protein
MRTRALAEKVKGFFASGSILAHDANAQMQLVMFLNCRADWAVHMYVLYVQCMCMCMCTNYMQGFVSWGCTIKKCKIVSHRNYRTYNRYSKTKIIKYLHM